MGESFHLKGGPVYFRPKPNGMGAWGVEVFDRDFAAMGLASKDRKVLLFESEREAIAEARKRGLKELPNVF